MQYIDTHCHLNFKTFSNRVPTVVKQALGVGVVEMLVVGTNILNSKRAVELSDQHGCISAAVGIHPHHVWPFIGQDALAHHLDGARKQLEKLLVHPRVKAVGETGFDRHAYPGTKYQGYRVHDVFLEAQQAFFVLHVELAHAYNKALILHNREAVSDLLSLLEKNPALKQQLKKLRLVFHCCEPDLRLLALAEELDAYVGVDGDCVYSAKKQQFVAKIPLNRLVLETDAPFFPPVIKKSVNSGELPQVFESTPADIVLIAKAIAELKNVPLQSVSQATSHNANTLFNA